MTTHVQNAFTMFLLAALVIFSGTQSYSSVPLPTRTTTDATATFFMQLGSRVKITSLDCSHLVHAFYAKAGLPYRYATSRALYGGRNEFRRVLQPDSGDLVVWRGHVGIVIDPTRHSFLSALRRRIKVSSYVSNYWKKRGEPRFLKFGWKAA